MKPRFTAVDIAAMVGSLRPHLLGSRVLNVYDIGGKLFLIKFTTSIASAETEEQEDEDKPDRSKPVLLIESGIRLHLTEVERKKSQIPSGWTMNLRKLIKGKQLERMDQIGVDRVVVLQFGIAEKAINIILEMYAKGNIVVTDLSGKVLMLLRSHSFDDVNVVAKGEVYPLSVSASVGNAVTENWETRSDIIERIKEIDSESLKRELADLPTMSKKKQKSAIQIMKAERVLSRIVPFAHSSLLQKALSSAVCSDPLHMLHNAVEICVAQLEVAKASLLSPQGFVSFKNGAVESFACTESLLDSTAGVCNIASFPTFSAAVDEYYSKIEATSEADTIEAQRKALLSRVENIKADQERRIEELRKEQDVVWEQAEELQANLALADAAISIVNALVAQQLGWGEIKELVAAQAKAGHLVASHIGRIDFTKNRAEVVFSETTVWMDLSLNAAGNVSALHVARKAMKEKLGKTEEQAAQAIRQAELKLKSDITKLNDSVERNRHLSKVRRRFWFEKFYWFITSEGYLVIAGRDATQNEAIYKKYLRKGDVYVHADIHGAATVVVKNRSTEADAIAPLSLAEAGQFSLCHSSAWNSKIVTSAWWVRADQVSKTAPTGEYLTTGSFMIRGKKNFLPPSRLELGVGLLFYISEYSAQGREPERIIRSTAEENGEDEDSEFAPTTIVGGGGVVPKPKQQEKAKQATSRAKPVVPAAPPQKIPSETKKKPKKAQKKNDKWFPDEEESEDERIRQVLVGGKKREIPVPAVVEEMPLVASAPKTCYKCGQSGHLAAECPMKPSSGKVTAKPPPEDTENPVEEWTETSVLLRLVANVRPNVDEVIHAVPVCGPYPAIAGYTNKLKVIPGSVKRGKAAKLVSQLFGGSCSPDLCKKLVKVIPVEEFSECLVNEVKVSGAGVTKVQIELKKDKKAKGKSKS